MTCPSCGGTRTKTVATDALDSKRRMYQCLLCRWVFLGPPADTDRGTADAPDDR